MENDAKKVIHNKIREVHFQQALYTMEHKKESKELLDELRTLRKEYAHQLTIEMSNERGEDENAEHKRK